MAHESIMPEIKIVDVTELARRAKERVTNVAHSVGSLVRNTNVQLCESDHYVREHFTDAPVQPLQGLPPAQRFEE